MARHPLVLLHGYSDKGESYARWRQAFEARGIPTADINICNYVSLNNEISIDDIAEGFERGLRAKGLAGKPFDAMVHSTGMLVLRSWLTATNAAASRQGLLKHLIALAPATFGSPLAMKGRSLLGRIFKGSKVPGPDFLASGNEVLLGLELGSPYTWNLAHQDMIGRTVYGLHNDTPYVFIFDGTNDYGKLAEIFDHSDQEGSDGTVRWAGCALSTRKITLDLSHTGDKRFSWSDWTSIDIPMIPVAGVNHGEILSQPPAELIDLVRKALDVNSGDDFHSFHAQDVQGAKVVQDGRAALAGKEWQQFLVRAVDSRDNPVTDYSIEILARRADGTERSLKGFEERVHPYSKDSSYACFHVRLGSVTLDPAERLVARIIASTGTDLMGYQGYGPGAAPDATSTFGPVDIDISDYDGRHPGNPALFYPFTTTLVEIRLNREPIARGDGSYEIFGWLEA